MISAAADDLRALSDALPKSAGKAAKAILGSNADRLVDVAQMLAKELDRPDPSHRFLRRAAGAGKAAAVALTLAASTGVAGGASQTWTEHLLADTAKIANAVSIACDGVEGAREEWAWRLTFHEPSTQETAVIVTRSGRVVVMDMVVDVSLTGDGVRLTILEVFGHAVRERRQVSLRPGMTNVGSIDVRRGIAFVDGLAVSLDQVPHP